MNNTPPLLSVRSLHVSFRSEDNSSVPVIRDVDLEVHRGQVVGLVGESGSGKTVTSLAVMGLLDRFAQVRGDIRLDGEDLLALGRRDWERIRGRRISMIFQDPVGSLNPVYRVGHQVEEALRRTDDAPGAVGSADRRNRVLDLFARVGITHPRARYREYPHTLSGGMNQRVAIAMALAAQPELLIADEPTTALDVTIQAQILQLLLSLRDELGLAILLITHDLGVVAEYCDFVYVMYAGKVVERGPVERLFEFPSHPYTRGLLASVPSVHTAGKNLKPIEGRVPDLRDMPSGCSFVTRCPSRLPECKDRTPPEVAITSAHHAACHLLVESRSAG